MFSGHLLGDRHSLIQIGVTQILQHKLALTQLFSVSDKAQKFLFSWGFYP